MSDTKLRESTDALYLVATGFVNYRAGSTNITSSRNYNKLINFGDTLDVTKTAQNVSIDVQVASQAEVDAGAVTNKFITPSTLSNYPGLGGGAATALATTGADVVVNSSAPPTTGQTLVATSPTNATWQTPASGLPVVSTFTFGTDTFVSSNSSAGQTTASLETIPLTANSAVLVVNTGGTSRYGNGTNATNGVGYNLAAGSYTGQVLHMVMGSASKMSYVRFTTTADSGSIYYSGGTLWNGHETTTQSQGDGYLGAEIFELGAGAMGHARMLMWDGVNWTPLNAQQNSAVSEE